MAREIVIFQEILADPLKLAMGIILVALEVPAAIVLLLAWRKACRDRRSVRGDGREP